MAQAIRDEIIEELLKKFPDFKCAYNEDGLSVREFDTFGPTVRTLRPVSRATRCASASSRSRLRATSIRSWPRRASLSA